MRARLFLLGCMVAVVAAADRPTQIHLAFAGHDDSLLHHDTATGMTVSWSTKHRTQTSTVWYGLESGRLNLVARGASLAYDETWHHHTPLRDLKAATRYYYKCGDDRQGYSEEYSFTTAFSASGFKPFKVAVIGDVGGAHEEETLTSLKKLSQDGTIDWVWHLGDIAYADDAFLRGHTYEGWWDKYMEEVQGFAARVPYMVAPGNHEAECHSPKCQLSLDQATRYANFTAYNARFRMPSQESGGVQSMWYSFNYGNAHFIQISTETDYPSAPGDRFRVLGGGNGGFGNQLEWLERDLVKAQSQRHLRPWILVNGHRPIYSVSRTDKDHEMSSECVAMQRAFEPLFHKYGVDLYLCGHVHAYERQWPVYQNQTMAHSYDMPPCTVHIIDGAGGCVEGLSVYEDYQQASWNAYINSEGRGYGILSVQSDTELQWRYYLSRGDRLVDAITIRKPAPR